MTRLRAVVTDGGLDHLDVLGEADLLTEHDLALALETVSVPFSTERLLLKRLHSRRAWRGLDDPQRTKVVGRG